VGQHMYLRLTPGYQFAIHPDDAVTVRHRHTSISNNL
jgi:hypothetical protein